MVYVDLSRRFLNFSTTGITVYLDLSGRFYFLGF